MREINLNTKGFTKLNMGQSPESVYYNTKKVGLPFYQGKTDYGDVYLKESKTYTSEVTKISKKNDILMSVRAPVGPVNLNPFNEICINTIKVP